MRTWRLRSKAVMGCLVAACLLMTFGLMSLMTDGSKTNNADSIHHGKPSKDDGNINFDFDDSPHVKMGFDRRSIQQVNNDIGGNSRDKLANELPLKEANNGGGNGLNDNTFGEKFNSNNNNPVQKHDIYVDGGQRRPPLNQQVVQGLQKMNQQGQQQPQQQQQQQHQVGQQQPQSQVVLKNGKFIAGNRIVHFDLKGAAPSPDYLKKMFSLIRSLGGTGVLLEWEDMFPYDGPLAAAVHKNAYSKAQIREILQSAVDNNLDIVPLVQTFGHLEWFLKLPQFAKYRQVERYPQVICLGDEQAVNIVRDMLTQVIAIHNEFPMPYFHMGADEAFQVGMCRLDQELMEKQLQGSRERLMLRHIAHIASHILKETNNKTKVLMWHDMLNNVDSTLLNQYSFGSLVEPVVWMYAENLDDQIYPDMWQRFGETFPNIWAASAFKGADGPHRFYSNVPHYLKNHVSWLTHMTAAYRSFRQFRGIILTGWQRFDHFAILCEIWPVGVPSMAVNLQVITEGIYDRNILSSASRLLNCSQTMDIDYVGGIAGQCRFPGYAVYENIQRLQMALQNIQTSIDDDYQVKGWLSRYNMVHNISQAWYLDQINDKVSMAVHELQQIQDNLRREMPPVFQSPVDTTDEFIFTNIEPHLSKLLDMQSAIRRLTAQTTFPVRPFDIQLNRAVSGSSTQRQLANNNVHNQLVNNNNANEQRPVGNL